MKNTILNEALEKVQDRGEELKQVGEGILNAFFLYIEKEKSKAYHQGMRDGLILKKSAVQLSEKLRRMELPIDQLELSVRTSNVLRMAGIETIEQFLELNRNYVMRLPNAGVKTWREVDEVQRYLKGEV